MLAGVATCMLAGVATCMLAGVATCMLAGVFILLVGPPKSDKLQDRGQTK